MEEIWKDVIGYEGLYQVSNLGNVKSLPKKWTSGRGLIRSHNGKILMQIKDSRGYLRVGLYNNEGKKIFSVHKLVAITFIKNDYTLNKLVVDHINDDPSDNRLCNLQLVTQRFNSCKTQGKYTSKYKGVSFFKERNKWSAQIQINGKNVYLGRYETELEAHLAYNKQLNIIENGK